MRIVSSKTQPIVVIQLNYRNILMHTENFMKIKETPLEEIHKFLNISPSLDKVINRILEIGYIPSISNYEWRFSIMGMEIIYEDL